MPTITPTTPEERARNVRTLLSWQTTPLHWDVVPIGRSDAGPWTVYVERPTAPPTPGMPRFRGFAVEWGTTAVYWEGSREGIFTGASVPKYVQTFLEQFVGMRRAPAGFVGPDDLLRP